MIKIVTGKRWKRLLADNAALRRQVDRHQDAIKELSSLLRGHEKAIEYLAAENRKLKESMRKNDKIHR